MALVLNWSGGNRAVDGSVGAMIKSIWEWLFGGGGTGIGGGSA